MTYQPNNQRSRRDRSSRPNSKKRKHNNSNSNNHTNNSNNSKITKRNKKTTYSSRDNNRYNSRYNNNNSSHPAQPHYTPPPRHRKEHKHNKHRGGHYINNVKCEDIPVPEPINNKRRPSYSDTINEEEQEQHHKEEEEEEDEEDEEREEHDLICEESPISDITTNEHIHSDSNPSENEKNVYLHNNRKHNYYYQRKPISNTSNKPIIPSPNIENQLIIHNGDDVHIKMNGNINPNSIESTQFELDLLKNNINHNNMNMNMNMNNNNNMNNNSNITPNYAASASSCSRSPAYSAPNQNDYPPINNMNLNTINNPYQQQQQQQYVTNTNNIGCYNNNMYNNNGYDMAYTHYHTHYNNHNHNHHHHHSHHAHQYPLYPPYINGYNITGTNINNITPPSIPTSSTSTSGSRAATPSLQSSSYNIMYDQSVQPPFYQMDGEFFVSIDVECAATGYGHFDSAPCRIAMVDFFGNILFDEIATVPNIVDPLLEFTGLTKHDIATKGDSLDHVLSRFHAELSQLNKTYKYGVTIVGQSVIMDIIWTKLRKNLHYNRTIDIAHQFRTKNEKWSSKYTYYSLRQVAWALLKRGMNDKYHDPTEDARVTIQLYRDFCLDADDIETAKRILKEYKYKNAFPDFRVHTKFTQCSGMYSPNKCVCGQKTAQGINGINQIEKLRKLYQEHANKPVLYRKYNHY